MSTTLAVDARDRAIRIESILVVRWSRRISIAEIGRVTSTFIDSRRAAGKQLVSISLLDPDTEQPSEDVLAEFARFLPIVGRLADVWINVFPPDAPQAAVLRANATAFASVLCRSVDFHHSLSAALRASARTIGIDPDDAIATAARYGWHD